MSTLERLLECTCTPRCRCEDPERQQCDQCRARKDLKTLQERLEGLERWRDRVLPYLESVADSDNLFRDDAVRDVGSFQELTQLVAAACPEE